MLIAARALAATMAAMLSQASHHATGAGITAVSAASTGLTLRKMPNVAGRPAALHHVGQ